MKKFRLNNYDPVPDDFHVARYCFPGTVGLVTDGPARMVYKPRAFENRNYPEEGVSFSIMEYFECETDEEAIFKVCQHRGSLRVNEKGDFVKLNAGSVRARTAVKGRPRDLIYRKTKNPAHATLVANSLSVSSALSALANEEGVLFPVPCPVPDVIE